MAFTQIIVANCMLSSDDLYSNTHPLAIALLYILIGFRLLAFISIGSFCLRRCQDAVARNFLIPQTLSEEIKVVKCEVVF